MKIGILTGGGDCAGENDVIRSATMMCEHHEHELYGILDGWLGLVDFNEIPLNKMVVDDWGRQSGTKLRTSRTNPFNFKGKGEDKSDMILKNFWDNGYDALIVIGGEDTLGVAQKLYEKSLEVYKKVFPVVAIPKTMDRDLQEDSIGYDTAVAKAAKHIDDLQTTAKSHKRIFVVEVFGRYTGEVALRAGIAGRADIIIIPEIKANIKKICEQAKKMYDDRVNECLDPYAIVVVAEGANIIMNDNDTYAQEGIKKDDFGHPPLSDIGIGKIVANEIEKRTGYETKSNQPSHVIRSGECGSKDSFIGETLGAATLYLIEKGEFGKAVYDVQGDIIKTIQIKDLIKRKSVDVKEIPFYEAMGIRFGRDPEVYKPIIETKKLE